MNNYILSDARAAKGSDGNPIYNCKVTEKVDEGGLLEGGYVGYRNIPEKTFDKLEDNGTLVVSMKQKFLAHYKDHPTNPEWKIKLAVTPTELFNRKQIDANGGWDKMKTMSVAKLNEAVNAEPEAFETVTGNN